MNLQNDARITGESNDRANRVTAVLFIIYLVALFWILVCKLGVRFTYMAHRNVNLIPFSHPLMGEIILNTIIFVPLGIYAGVLFKRWHQATKLFFVLLTSISVEVFQFIWRVGAFDITDIIVNTLGGIIGSALFMAIEKICNNSAKAQRFINIVAAIGTAVMVLLLLLLKLNMLPIRYQ